MFANILFEEAGTIVVRFSILMGPEDMFSFEKKTNIHWRQHPKPTLTLTLVRTNQLKWVLRSFNFDRVLSISACVCVLI
jgi:hypothetical protein